MIAVAVALVTLKTRDQDERPFHADDADDIAQHVLAPPLVERFIESFRETVVDHAGEVLRVDAVVLIGAEKLLGANQPKPVEELGAERVVAGLTAVERHSDTRAPNPTAQPRQQTPMLVVWMRGGVHHAGDRAQLQQLLPGAGGAGVLRQRCVRRRAATRVRSPALKQISFSSHSAASVPRVLPCSPCSSEIKLHGQLNFPRVAQGARNAAERVEIGHARRRESVVHPVEQVECLDPQLESAARPSEASGKSTGSSTWSRARARS